MAAAIMTVSPGSGTPWMGDQPFFRGEIDADEWRSGTAGLSAEQLNPWLGAIGNR
jgi:hypothetical protein